MATVGWPKLRPCLEVLFEFCFRTLAWFGQKQLVPNYKPPKSALKRPKTAPISKFIFFSVEFSKSTLLLFDGQVVCILSQFVARG
jgi:hypothetical protein